MEDETATRNSRRMTSSLHVHIKTATKRTARRNSLSSKTLLAAWIFLEFSGVCMTDSLDEQINLNLGSPIDSQQPQVAARQDKTILSPIENVAPTSKSLIDNPAVNNQMTGGHFLKTETTKSSTLPQLPSDSAQSFCNLGNDTYQLGERWNPNLPPFGIQVCVQCECIARQRKNCFESKVSCRRITNECPIIDSCPDGTKPVTIAGQCCKSCQDSPQGLAYATQKGYSDSSAGLSYSETLITPAALTSDRKAYRNDRVKDYQALTKNLPPCPRRPESTDRPPSQLLSASFKSSGQRASKNDFNGIDTRLAFKSLENQNSVSESVKSPSPMYGQSEADGSSNAMGHDHQQHPGDAQPHGGNRYDFRMNQQAKATKSQAKRPVTNPLSVCTLGSETFQIGDRWNPILPPLGVQVCVQCNCIIKQRSSRNCYEAKLTCRRIQNECPKIDICPDKRRPVVLPDQCCKSCPDESNLQDSESSVDTTTLAPSTSTSSATTASLLSTTSQTTNGQSDGSKIKNDRLPREYLTIMQTMPVCVKIKEENDDNLMGRVTYYRHHVKSGNTTTSSLVKRPPRP